MLYLIFNHYGLKKIIENQQNWENNKAPKGLLISYQYLRSVRRGKRLTEGI